MLKSVIVVFIQIIVIIKKFRLGLGQFSSARSGRAGPSKPGAAAGAALGNGGAQWRTGTGGECTGVT